MDTRSQILRWREIVHPLFWPVFFWNLRKFARFLRLRIEASGNGLISFQVTWWGAIRIYGVIDPDAPKWDAGLEVGAQRVYLATLDIGNPFLSRRVPLSLKWVSETRRLRGSDLSQRIALSIEVLRAATFGVSHAGRGRRALLALGCFAEPAHLNTS
ncbi:MAG: hypothetical protein AAFQ22_13320 [Pseudomonadota bacterium]